MAVMKHALVGLVLALLATALCAGELAAGSKVTLSIEIQPMADALNQWAQKTGYQVIFPEESATADIVSPRLSGKFTAREALNRLLSGTNLVYEFLNGRTVAVRLKSDQTISPKPVSDSYDSSTTPLRLVQTDTPQSPSAPPSARAAGEEGLAEIIVTARRRSESLLSTPVAVTAFNAKDLEVRQITQIAEIEKSTPSLIYEASGGDSSEARIFIRGVGNHSASPAFGQGVGLYIDGAYFPRAQGALLNSLDIASLEVLRGPQGTLFGKNTIGGAINITTARPSTDAFSGALDADYGSFNEARVRGSINIPLGDKVAVRLAAMRFRNDGYTVNDVSGQRLDNDDLWITSGALRVKPTDDLTWDVNLFYSHDRNHGRGFQCTLGPDTDPWTLAGLPGVFAAACARTDANGIRHTRSDVDQPGGNDMFAASSTLAWDVGKLGVLDDLTIKGTGAYQWVNGSGLAQDLDGTDLDGIYAITPDFHLAHLSLELQILGQAFNKHLQFVFGAYGDDEYTPSGFDSQYARILPLFEPSAVLSFVNNIQLKNHSRAPYTQATWDFNDIVSLTGGVRYTKETTGFFAQKYRVSAFDPTRTPVGPFLTNNGRFSQDFSNVSPMASLQLNAPKAWTGNGFLDQAMIYFTYSKGFMSGGFNENGDVHHGNLTSFKPEHVGNYEVGVKFAMFDHRLTGSVTGFDMDYKDEQLSVGSFSARGLIVSVFNAGAEKIKGVEVELQALLFDSLRLSLNGDFSNAYYTKFDDASVPSGTRVGEPVPFIPDYRVSLSIENRFALGGDMALTPRVQVTDTGTRYLLSDPSPIVRALARQGQFTVVDASLRFDLNKNVSFDVYGKNIFNTAYKDDVESFGFVVTSYYAAPATYGVGARIKF